MIIPLPAAEKTMHRDAVDAYPNECCGFMFGREDENGDRIISEAMPINNAAIENRKRRFLISPKDYMLAEQFALDNNVQLLGVYHSHPDHPAEPSEHDRIAAQPWFSYVIISVSAAGVQISRSWVLNEALQFDEEQYSNKSDHINQ